MYWLWLFSSPNDALLSIQLMTLPFHAVINRHTTSESLRGDIIYDWNFWQHFIFLWWTWQKKMVVEIYQDTREKTVATKQGRCDTDWCSTKIITWQKLAGCRQTFQEYLTEYVHILMRKFDSTEVRFLSHRGCHRSNLGKTCNRSMIN